MAPGWLCEPPLGVYESNQGCKAPKAEIRTPPFLVADLHSLQLHQSSTQARQAAHGCFSELQQGTTLAAAASLHGSTTPAHDLPDPTAPTDSSWAPLQAAKKACIPKQGLTSHKAETGNYLLMGPVVYHNSSNLTCGPHEHTPLADRFWAPL